jgi:hypothetical protein
MADFNDIRTRFEGALNNQINESSQRNYMALAQSSNKNDKEMLYNLINTNEFKGKAPFQRIKLDSFSSANMAKVNKILSSNKGAATTLVNLGADVVGIGRGEIMMAYIIENCGIGGGSVDIDLTLYNDNGGILDQAECKEVKTSKDGYLYGWRTGAKHRSIIETAKQELKNLYMGLKDILPELNPNTAEGKDIQNKVARDEGAKFLNIVKDLDPVIVTSPLTFSMSLSPEGELIVSKTGGEQIGSISNNKTIQAIKNMISGQNQIQLKSYSEIERDLVAGFGSIKEKFVFVQTNSSKKFGGVLFKDNISSNVGETLISSWTGGSIQVKVKA